MSSAGHEPVPDIPRPVMFHAPDISAWREGNTGVEFTWRFESGVDGPDVLVTSLIHGNEYSGAVAMDELLTLLQAGARPQSGSLTCAFCNVDAFSRFDPADPDASRQVDEDMNRVWNEERLRGDTSEARRARALLPVVRGATHLLDLHSMHEPAPGVLLPGLLPRNVRFGASLQSSAGLALEFGHADGTRMRDCGQFGDPDGSGVALLLEAGQHWDLAALHTTRDVLWRFLVTTGVMRAADLPAAWRQIDPTPAAPVRVTQTVSARSRDFRFVAPYTGMEVIARQGTVIGYDNGEPVVTPYDDCVLVMPSVRHVRPGATIVRLGRRIDAAEPWNATG